MTEEESLVEESSLTAEEGSYKWQRKVSLMAEEVLKMAEEGSPNDRGRFA